MAPGKLLIFVGIILVIVGVIWTIIGKLPGDFTFKKGNVTVYFPLMTSVILSVILTLILWLIGKFNGR
ncbi:MAG TPA: DUF2905 domain-containing protein [Candidatus Avamphibacillus intestinigallinarum]|nr:DUF2905 domain-containing protein [Candidatus Avamphibacillus intestinigallinarum]